MSSDAPHTPAPSATHGAIARQSILDANRVVIGYELFDRSSASHSFTAASDAEMLFNILSHPEYESLIGRKTLFVNCTFESLAGGHLDLIQPERLVLEVPTVAHHDPEEIESRLQLLKDVRQRGFRLAISQTLLTRPYASWIPLAAFVKLDFALLTNEQIQTLVEFVRKHSKAQIIAEKVETAEQFEFACGLGIGLFQGYWFAKPVLIPGQVIRPSQANIIHLINLVRQQASTTDIEEVIKRDPTLSFNLLRFINSAGFGLSREITSFRHAVMVLGLQKLFRWAALLLTTSKTGQSAPAIGSTAVVRGRLMELLVAEKYPDADGDNAFVVGIFSLLDAMLGLPMEKALESITLPEQVRDALLHKEGELAQFLELAIACEQENESQFASLAQHLDLTNHQINWSHLQALAWAENMVP